MKPLQPKERRALRARAHNLQPVVMIGDAGLTPAVLAEIGVNLKSHQLLKIRVLGDDRPQRQRMIDDICSALDASLVQHIGKLLVIYRPAPEPEPDAKKPARRSKPRKQPRRSKRSYQND